MNNFYHRMPADRLLHVLAVALFYAAATFVLMKDALNVVDHYISLPVAPSLITLALCTACVPLFILCGHQSKFNKLFLVSMASVIFTYIMYVVYLVAVAGQASSRDIFGVYLVNGAIPLFVIAAAGYCNASRLIFKPSYIGIMTGFVLTVSFFQIGASYIFEHVMLRELMSLYDEGLLAFPLQTATGQILIRINGPFYSAFALCLFLSAASSYYLFRREAGFFGNVMVVLCFIVVLFTYNRNGLMVFMLVVASGIVFRLFGFHLRHFMGAALLILGAATIIVPFSIAYLGPYATDSYPWLKSSTLFSRLSTWGQILSYDSSAFLVGTGFVQGLDRVYGGQRIFIDNFYIYIAYQVGVFGLCAFLFAIFAVPARMLFLSTSSLTVDALRAYYLLCCGLMAFVLNITFFEPVFQIMFFGPALGIVTSSAVDLSGRALFLSKMRARP